MPITTEPAPPEPINPDLYLITEPRGYGIAVDSLSPEHCLLIHDADGETIVRVRRRIHPADLSTLLDFGRRRFQDGRVFGEDALAAKFRALLEPRPRGRG